MTSQTKLHGAETTRLDNVTAQQCVEWVLGCRDAAPDEVADVGWAVLQCDLSLVWAIRLGSKWVLASDACPHLQPPDAATLRELRAFGPRTEALIWRADSAFCGRFLGDTGCTVPAHCEPIEHYMAFESGEDPAAVSPLGQGFAVRTRSNGRLVVTPEGDGVLLRQYLGEDQGVLRIAATRLVEVR
jgi:hypothetical protein